MQSIDHPSAGRCTSCKSALAHDQHYCVECGTRRGPLRAPMADVVNRILESGSPVRAAVARPGSKRRPAPRPAGARRAGWIDLWHPNPIAASLAVMAMLGFGVIVGDISGAKTLLEAASPNRSIVVNFPARSAPTSAPTSFPSGSGGGTASSGSSSQSSASSGGSSSSSGGSSGTGSGTVAGPLALPPVKHVFLIVLSNQGFNQSFSLGSTDPYLNKTLPAQGELIQNYYAVAGSSLANEIAMLSGQGPTVDTESNCPTYSAIGDFTKGSDAQIVGNGCAYPKTTGNLATELTKKHDTWKAYLQGLSDGPKAQLKDCGAPAPDSGQYAAPTAADSYVAWRNPFAYFAALKKKPSCRATDVPLTALQKDLKQASTTPSLSFIVPDACHDGDSQPCHPGAAAGLTPANGFLKQTLKLIKASPAYKASGLIIITFDHAPQTGPLADPSACCSTPAYPNISTASTTPTALTTPTTPTTPTTTTTTPGVTTSTTSTGPYAIAPTTTTATTTTTTPGYPCPGTTTTATTTGACPPADLGGGETTPTGGGGEVGLLLISKYVKPGSSDVIDYFNHYSLLAGMEALFKVKLLAYAGDISLPRFPVELYNYHSTG